MEGRRLTLCGILIAILLSVPAFADTGQTVTTSSGLQYIDLAEGTGRQAEIGDTATVHYTGWLADGTKFDSSLDRKEPFSFRVGSGQVIQG